MQAIPATPTEITAEIGMQTLCMKQCRPFFAKKGNDIIYNELTRVIAIEMKCSFCVKNEHYSLKRIKAKMKLTEFLYTFFDIHTVNIVQLIRRKAS